MSSYLFEKCGDAGIERCIMTMKPATRIVLQKLKDLAGPGGSIKIAQNELADLCEIPLRTLQRHLDKLEKDHELISVKRVKSVKDNKWKNEWNTYTPICRPSESCIENPASQPDLVKEESESIEESESLYKEQTDATMTCGILPGLAPSTYRRWIKKFGAEKTAQAINHARRYADKNPAGFANAWLHGKFTIFSWAKPKTIAREQPPPCPACGGSCGVVDLSDPDSWMYDPHSKYRWWHMVNDCDHMWGEPIPGEPKPCPYTTGPYADFIDH
jgi:hypothetical protein